MKIASYLFGNVTPTSKCPFLWAAETRKRKIKYINGRVDDMTILFIGTVNGSLGSGFSSVGIRIQTLTKTGS